MMLEYYGLRHILAQAGDRGGGCGFCLRSNPSVLQLQDCGSRGGTFIDRIMKCHAKRLSSLVAIIGFRKTAGSRFIYVSCRLTICRY